MTRNARLALGGAATLPAVVTTALPSATDALIAAASGNGDAVSVAASGLAAILLASLGVVLYFAWLAVGADERGLGWKLGWVLALTLFGVVTAPAFWYLYIWRGRDFASAA